MVVWTHCGLVMPYGDRSWVNIGSGNDLSPDGNNQLPKPMLTTHQWGLVSFPSGQFPKHFSSFLSSDKWILLIPTHINNNTPKKLTHWGHLMHKCIISNLYHISLVQIKACCQFGNNPLSQPMMAYCQLDPKEHISIKYLKFRSFH